MEMITTQYATKYNDAHLVVIKITETAQEMMLALENFEEYSLAYHKVPTEKRQREFLGARILINKILNKQVKIDYTEHGKPILVNHDGFISISHSKNYLALIYHPSKSVGLDIECPTERVLKVYKRFLNAEEQSYLSKDLTKIQLAWSAKEAIYKVVGEEAVDFSLSMTVRNFEQTNEGTFFCDLQNSGTRFNLHYFVSGQYNLVYTIQ